MMLPFEQRDPDDESSELVIAWKDESLTIPHPWRYIDTGMHGAADADHHEMIIPVGSLDNAIDCLRITVRELERRRDETVLN